MKRPNPAAHALLVGALFVAASVPAFGQAVTPGVTGRVSVHFDAIMRKALDGAQSTGGQLSTALNFESPESGEGPGFDFRFDMRHSKSVPGERPDRVSIYDAY